jgi:hypothetical protein
MNPSRCGVTLAKPAFLSLFTVLSAALLLSSARGQDASKDASKNASKNASADAAAYLRAPLRLGYTRPGNPPDDVKPDGGIRPVAMEANYEGIGGTVYFAVLQLNSTEVTPWGTRLPDFLKTFTPGRGLDGRGESPALDPQARYLYLYQVVNDRGVDRAASQIKPAGADPELNGREIGMARINLVVDPRYLTSWGAFKDLGFAVDVTDKGGPGGAGPRFAGLNDESKHIRLAVSCSPSVTDALPEKAYLDRCPAYELPDVLSLQSPLIGLKETGLIQQLAKKQQDKNIKLAAYEQNLLKASTTAHPPDVVEIVPVGPELPFSPALPGFDPTRLPLDAPPLDVTGSGGRPVARFRARWLGKNTLQVGEHSTLYGFTTNLPPQDEEVRIRSKGEGEDIEEAPAPRRGLGMRPAAEEVIRVHDVRTADDRAENKEVSKASEGAADVQDLGTEDALAQATGTAPTGTATGTAPTPNGGAGAGGPGVGGVGPGSLGGAPPLPGIGGGGGFAGTGGFSRPAVAMGSPVAAGGGTGSGSGQGTTTPTQSQSVVIGNITQSQAQTQQQQQQQQQQQKQSQTGTPGNVVPEPAAFLLGLFGLPLLFLFRLRKGMVGVAA